MKDELQEVRKFVQSELAKRARQLRTEACDVLVQNTDAAKAYYASLRDEVDERLSRLEHRLDALARMLGESAAPDRSSRGPGALVAAASAESGGGGVMDPRTG